ncbi:mRNA surveillance protein pelota [Thermoplasma sp. Kam2015]|uniref:mRNA surveillance protein pelota n=1 Tax=Thermoplasma sp. Kam2015 TaxID=2094122 RepID=UPI000D835189|nr:mRNA surveillance protein pelota [Thermoplasma sp. Kam2015]PYB67946.1 mRNA surveillance protein pelota [Thermoplasma sp. Kam2015]
MRILEEDLKDSTIRVRIESLDDLWYIRNILSEGDVVSAITFRRVEESADVQRSRERERIPITIKLKVEKIEFQDFDNRLRVLGTVIEGPEDTKGKHQSITITTDSEIAITKEWDQQHMDLLKEATDEKYVTVYTAVAMDEDEAQVFIIHPYGIQQIGTVFSGRSGKYAESAYSESAYFDEIINAIKNYRNRIIVLGPGFARDRFARYCNEKGIRVIGSFPSNRTDSGSVYEFITSADGKRIMSEERISRDKEIVDEFLRAVKKDMAVYGRELTKNALEAGALSDIIMTDEIFRTEEGRAILSTAESLGTKIHIVSVSNDPGQMIKKFGGVAGLLRFKPQ